MPNQEKLHVIDKKLSTHLTSMGRFRGRVGPRKPSRSEESGPQHRRAGRKFWRTKSQSASVTKNDLEDRAENIAEDDETLAESASATCETHADTGQCPSGHILEQVSSDLTGICSVCNWELPANSSLWACRRCDFDLCDQCRNERDPARTDAGKMLLAMIRGGAAANEDATGTDAGKALLALISGGDPPVTTNGEAALEDAIGKFGLPCAGEDGKQDNSDGSDHTTLTPVTADGLYEWSDNVLSFGDEFVPGPDGELWEIFYPSDCEPEESSTTVFSPADDHDSRSPSPASAPLVSEENSEPNVALILDFMSRSAVESFPTRAALFELVRAAAVAALGRHFQRFVLVGSTAMRIDTPDSDLDAVIFTQSAWEDDVEVPAPWPAEVLHLIAESVRLHNGEITVQVVDCTRVPVLTVVSADGAWSLDLSVDEPLGEFHVLWFQGQQKGTGETPAPLYSVPQPTSDDWSQGFEAAVLRCVKWWLRRRRIPVPKEGGYPSIVWTLMVLHVLRCSVFVSDSDESNQGRAVLGAIAAFFDRFADFGLAGTFLFSSCSGAQFRKQLETDQHGMLPDSLSVLDPTTNSEESAALGMVPAELVPKTSAATQLLYSYELRRAQRLSAAALARACGEGRGSSSADSSADPLQQLFTGVDRYANTIPASMPSGLSGVIVLRDHALYLGVLEHINTKPKWKASFLHRRDAISSFSLRRCNIDATTGRVTHMSAPRVVEWFYPTEFVCMASLHFDAHLVVSLEAEDLQRWQDLHALLGCRSAR
mmetsp:Transcript_138589/g.240256  ORF Transcript_138589/g.240256 Transcript_138589/m.240256 type:complete len:769 (-) Transcript_138589:387-2693(-)